MEFKIYTYLKSSIGIPKCYYFSSEKEYRVLIIELLGPDLDIVLQQCKGKFTLSTILLLAIQMITRIEFLHKHNYIHRDIKPENFLLGYGTKSNIVFLIDFGLSKRFQGGKSKLHIPYRQSQPLTGTMRYASINTHLEVEQSRRDDLESIAYILIYFYHGKLPWMHIKAGHKGEMQEKIMEMKQSLSAQTLCHSMPDEFPQFLNSARNLKFEEEPDYETYKKMFKNILFEKFHYGQIQYDWEPIFNQGETNKTNHFRPKLFKYHSENRIKIGTKIKKHHKVNINTTKNIEEENSEINQDIKTKRGNTVIPLDQFEFFDLMEIPSEINETSQRNVLPNSSFFIKFKTIGGDFLPIRKSNTMKFK